MVKDNFNQFTNSLGPTYLELIESIYENLDKNKNPNYSALESVGKQIRNLITNGTLIIVESTVEPGYIENTFVKILEGEDGKLIVGKDFVGSIYNEYTPSSLTILLINTCPDHIIK